MIRAYSNSVSTAIDEIGLVQLINKKIISLTVEYPLLDKLNYYLLENNYQIKDTSYTDKVTIAVAVSEQEVDKFLEDITNLLANQFKSSIGDTEIFEVDFEK
ncbi:protein co-occurring with transport systems [Lentilactobacillus kosonis]|uniref:Protein co-occurring with transport systems n=1 Tax=Lentilactobacillus kosonis TaxID=2810561 RepID=A0A401FJV3_9LACO|nr:protein co-occurring with transport systems [Lentilactobacillus kosonis]